MCFDGWLPATLCAYDAPIKRPMLVLGAPRFSKISHRCFDFGEIGKTTFHATLDGSDFPAFSQQIGPPGLVAYVGSWPCDDSLGAAILRGRGR